MYINKRLDKILDMLIQNDYSTIDKISKVLNISKRTAYYDMVRLSDYLQRDNIELNNVRSLGYYVSKEDKEELNKLLKYSREDYILSPDERAKKIIIDLLMGNEKLNIEKLYTKLQVSRNTILGDLKEVRDYIKKYDLELISQCGYEIVGRENKRRYLLINLYNEYGYLFSEYEFLEEYKAIVDIIQKEKANVLEHRDIKYALMYLTSFYKYYYKKVYKIDYLEKHKVEFLDSLSSKDEAKTVLEIIRKELDKEIDDKEVYYIQVFLAKDEDMRVFMSTEILEEKYMYAINNMVKEFEKISCISIEDYENLSKNIFHHLKPSLFRVSQGIYYPNNIKNEVKKNYKSIYQFTRQVVKHVENKLGIFLNDDEVAYVAMYFGGYTTKMGVEIKIPKIVIVCNHGMATSQLLKSQIEQLFDLIEIDDILSLKSFKEYTRDYDFAISTVDINEDNEKIIKVNSILTDLDKQNLISHISTTQSKFNDQQDLIKRIIKSVEKNATIHNKERLKDELKNILISNNETLEVDKGSLSDFINENMISLNKEAKDWKEAIRVGCETLKEKDYIEDNYIDIMIKNIEKLGPYIVITENVAMPHARPEDGVKKLGISITTFKEEIKFSSNKKHNIRVLITLAPKDRQSHLKSLVSLNKILSKKENIDSIINATSKNEIIELVKKHSK